MKLMCLVHMASALETVHSYHLYLKRRVARYHVPRRPVTGRQGERGRRATPIG